MTKENNYSTPKSEVGSEVIIRKGYKRPIILWLCCLYLSFGILQLYTILLSGSIIEYIGDVGYFYFFASVIRYCLSILTAVFLFLHLPKTLLIYFIYVISIFVSALYIGITTGHGFIVGIIPLLHWIFVAAIGVYIFTLHQKNTFTVK
jgi:hypothetical protein